MSIHMLYMRSGSISLVLSFYIAAPRSYVEADSGHNRQGQVKSRQSEANLTHPNFDNPSGKAGSSRNDIARYTVLKDDNDASPKGLGSQLRTEI